MRKNLVYLAGPITGLTYDGASDWREHAKTVLEQGGGTLALSPLRGKEFLRSIGVITGTGEEYQHLSVLSTGRGITTRDRFDATRCDVLLVNLLGAKQVSIGTVMEIAWADAKRIPIVCAMEDKGNPHEHLMVSEALGFRVPTLPDALKVVHAVLGMA